MWSHHARFKGHLLYTHFYTCQCRVGLFVGKGNTYAIPTITNILLYIAGRHNAASSAGAWLTLQIWAYLQKMYVLRSQAVHMSSYLWFIIVLRLVLHWQELVGEHKGTKNMDILGALYGVLDCTTYIHVLFLYVRSFIGSSVSVTLSAIQPWASIN